MSYKDLDKRKEATRARVRAYRDKVKMGVTPDECNAFDTGVEECNAQDVTPKVYPNYDMHPKHKDGCACMLCKPERWPDLKVAFEKHVLIKSEEGRKIFPNYDIHPAHAKNCDCLCCLGGVTGRDGKFSLMKDLLAGV